MTDINTLIVLAEKWEKQARSAFNSAEQQIDDPSHRPTGKQFIEHGATCYFNCAQDLRKFLTSSLLPPSAIQKER